MTASLLGLGTALPQYSVPQQRSAEMSAPMCCRTEQQQKVFGQLYRRSQVQSRHSVLLHEAPPDVGSNGHNGQGGNGDALSQSFFSPATGPDDAGPSTSQRMQQYVQLATPLAQRAADAALRDAHASPQKVRHLITVSCTGFAAPGLDIALIKRLGLSPQVSRTHVGFMGCHGAFNGLRLASALTQTDTQRDGLALVAAVELCTLHFAYGWDPQRIVANALFADGAGAVVIGNAPADRNGAAYRLAATGSTVLPDSEDVMGWRITDHGFEMALSPRVPDLIRQHLRPWLVGWLDTVGLTLGAVNGWAVHPGGPRILDSVAEALALDDAALADSRAVLIEHGNMSSPTILFILDRLRRRQAPRPWVALGFGPGLAVEAMLIV